jgi:hypothetical protein
MHLGGFGCKEILLQCVPMTRLHFLGFFTNDPKSSGINIFQRLDFDPTQYKRFCSPAKVSPRQPSKQGQRNWVAK